MPKQTCRKKLIATLYISRRRFSKTPNISICEAPVHTSPLQLHGLQIWPWICVNHPVVTLAFFHWILHLFSSPPVLNQFAKISAGLYFVNITYHSYFDPYIIITL